jgi:hypothetical protein
MYKQVIYDAYTFDMKPSNGEFATVIYLNWKETRADNHLVFKAMVTASQSKVFDINNLYPAYAETKNMPGIYPYLFNDKAHGIEHSPYMAPIYKTGNYRIPIKMMPFERILTLLIGNAVIAVNEKEAASVKVNQPSTVLCGWANAYGTTGTEMKPMHVIKYAVKELY